MERTALTPSPTAPEPVQPHQREAMYAGYHPAEVDLIRRTIAPEATEHELALYLRLCRTYGLDPFRRELVLEKRRRRRADGSGYDVTPVFITTRDGYLKAAMRDPGYGGLISGVVCEGDTFELDAQQFRVVHRFGARRGKILGAWAIAYHRERPPVVAYVPVEEYYDANSDTWRKHPSAMIQKVAEVFVLRRQYSISGIVAREEVGRDLTDDRPRRRGATRQALPAAPTLPAPAAPPAPSPSEGVRRPGATGFWTAVRKTAIAQGTDPLEWVRARTGGETDLRKLDDETVARLYAEATQAGADAPQQEEVAEQAPAPTRTPEDAPAVAEATDTTTGEGPPLARDRIARLQALWKQRGVGPRAQAAMVRAASGGRTAIAGELTAAELDTLIASLEAHPS